MIVCISSLRANLRKGVKFLAEGSDPNSFWNKEIIPLFK